MPDHSRSASEARNAAVHPFDAASLLLVDRKGAQTRILMGRRHPRLVFMPGKFVFPGGRTDPADGEIAAASELHDSDIEKLLSGMGTQASVLRARAIGLSAIRETFEETGLRVARASSKTIILPDNDDWCAFLENGMLPALGELRYFARAITPPGHVRRYDTRFFIAFRDSLPGLETQKLAPSGELEELDWVAIDDVDRLEVADITRAVLCEAKSLLTGAELPSLLPVVHLVERQGCFVREVI